MPIETSSSARRCLVSGATGYVGRCTSERLKTEGWQVLGLNRRAAAGSDAVTFRLGDDVAAEALAGASALVHCAFDFTPVAWKDICTVNVRGSERLLRAARQAGIRQIVVISSISAFDGCRSLYGKAKLELERTAKELGGWVIRPGLVYGSPPGGMFGRLTRSVRRGRLIPMPGGKPHPQYLVHDQDLGQAVCRCVASTTPAHREPITVAHEQPWSFGEILSEIARALDRKIMLVPVPWQLVWAGLRLAEGLHVPLGFRSDSLISLLHQNPRPDFNCAEILGVRCRPFRLAGETGSASFSRTPAEPKPISRI